MERLMHWTTFTVNPHPQSSKTITDNTEKGIRTALLRVVAAWSLDNTYRVLSSQQCFEHEAQIEPIDSHQTCTCR